MSTSFNSNLSNLTLFFILALSMAYFEYSIPSACNPESLANLTKSPLAAPTSKINSPLGLILRNFLIVSLNLLILVETSAL